MIRSMDRSARRQRIAAAVRRAAATLTGIRDRPNRYDRAESLVRDGWSEELVAVAIGAGALAGVRAVMFDSPQFLPPRLCAAAYALSVIDTQRELERAHAHGLSPHRSSRRPPRVRAI